LKVNELMERVGMVETGRAIAYIKDGLDEMNMISETHVTTARIDITKDQRFYDMPMDVIKLIDIRCKNHDNANNEYRSIPRSIHKPATDDADGI
jgi:hypothetical protein